VTDIDGNFRARYVIEELPAVVTAGSLDEIEADGYSVGSPIGSTLLVVVLSQGCEASSTDTNC